MYDVPLEDEVSLQSVLLYRLHIVVIDLVVIGREEKGNAK